MSTNKTGELVVEAAKRQAAEAAKYVRDADRQRQRELAASTHNKIVHDIFDFEDIHGDDIFVWVYRQPNTRDVKEGEKVVVMILFQEQGTTSHVRFDEVLVRGNRYYYKDGDSEDLLVTKLRTCQVPH